MRKKLNKLIYVEEYVYINGIEQFLFHNGISYDNPVMLYLHGGPGSAESLFTEGFQRKWEDLYTVIHWDQRGAGKTLTKNPDKYPTIDLLLKDLYDIVHYLKKKYNKNKVILLGHSWGSVLGSTFIKKYPEEISYYIGVGQVVSMLDNERVGYEKVKELILKKNDIKSLKKLEAIGEYPDKEYSEEWLKKCLKLRKLQEKYRLAASMNLSISLIAFKSPIFKLSDIIALMKAFKSNGKLVEFLVNFNLKLESNKYEIPVFYIMGGNDWQTPYSEAEEYFNKIEAPFKKYYLIPNAGHMTMLDQPDLFFEALQEITENRKQQI
ncbi:alpha/beta fold hydrolase [Clostridium folliculivorans]|uniref:Alpha/beta hydrolase n=1 Tax=Clostridium folliculivorans TaxID=2886038 RepID=A0A9W5Y1P9_9CLOT|nr:alpha/beta hydrolase [Clostridium folliculivorans]GKU24919.1 alpha/beta hydrolase [Clostridium folliculivorans]GKU31017.1 alpha/beta hydrolase [Clostridium folliculivorans]